MGVRSSSGTISPFPYPVGINFPLLLVSTTSVSFIGRWRKVVVFGFYVKHMYMYVSVCTCGVCVYVLFLVYFHFPGQRTEYIDHSRGIPDGKVSKICHEWYNTRTWLMMWIIRCLIFVKEVTPSSNTVCTSTRTW